MRCAIVGVGFMAWIHALAYARSTKAQLVGFASRDPKKRGGDWTSIRGNFGPPGGHIDVTGMNVTQTLDELLKDDSIDLIDICLPPHLHADAVAAVLQSGKRVLCEKPLALDAETAGELVGLAPPDRLMVAHILPFMPAFGMLLDAAADGRWGRVLGGRFQRTIGPPTWIPDFYDPQTVGGPLIDLHVHDAHLIRLLFGMPDSVDTVATHRDGVCKRYESLFRFAQPGVVVSAGGGVIDSPARPFTHGYEVDFERCTVQYQAAFYGDGQAAIVPLVVLHNDGRVERPELPAGDEIDAFVAEIDAAAGVVADRRPHPYLDGRIAADAITICQMQQTASQ